MGADADFIGGHGILALERFMDETRHMIIFDVLTWETPVGDKGERLRLFLSDEGYAKALASEKRGESRMRSKKKPRAANGTYTHRLSGLVYCADCGGRMSYSSPEAKHSEKNYDSDSSFQCGNYRNKGTECVSHFVKTSVLEAAILQAIQAVSKYVLENEEEFIAQLKAVWSENKSKHTDIGQQELEQAMKRMTELDNLIQNLYESSVKGTLPERQAQRMIQQYDEEQILIERRVEELKSQIQYEEVKEAETGRFIALVKKYKDCAELTDTMLYAFIDRIEVHEATGGRTIYHNFIPSTKRQNFLYEVSVAFHLSKSRRNKHYADEHF